jgi:signal transduction histidine kinase
MRPVAIGPLQFCVGLYCVSLGTLMLITPHQFLTGAFLPWQAYIAWWGVSFVLAGCLLFGAALMQVRKQRLVLIHLFAGGALLTLMYIYGVTRAWTAFNNYLLLGVGTAVAPLIMQWQERRRQFTPSADEQGIPAPPLDIFTLLMGLAAMLLGLMMFVAPEWFQASVYDTIRPYLLLHGAAFLIGGVLLFIVNSFLPHYRVLVAFSHVFAGCAFLAFCLTVAIPTRSLTGIAFYGGFGLSVLILPWLSTLFIRIDPTRLQTRLALAFIALSALPLMLSVAVISEREANTSTQQMLARERLLARNLARNTETFVGLHQAATELLAQRLSRAPATTDDHTPLLTEFQQVYPSFRTVLSYDANGTLIFRRTISDDREPAEQPTIYRAVRDSLQTQIGVGPTQLATAPVIIIGAPILTPSGAFDGIVIALLDSVQLAQMWSDSAQIAEGEVYLVDAGGRVIASPDAKLVAAFSDRSTAPPVAAALAKQQDGSQIYDSATGSRLSSYAPVGDLSWYVIIDRPAESILSGLRAGQNVTVGILLLVVAVAAFVSVLLARTLTIPLTMLTRATRMIARSDNESLAPLPQSNVYEVATLAEQFAELQSSLKQRTAERNRAEQRLQLLADAGSVLTTSLDADKTLQQITQLMVPALGDWGLIYLVADDGSINLAAATHSDPGHREITKALYTRYALDPAAAHGVANVLRTGRPEVVTQITDEMLELAARDNEHLRLLKLIGFHDVMIVPLNARGRTLGALVLVSADAQTSYDAEDLALAEDLAQRAALAAANAQLYTAERGARQEAEAARTEAEVALGARDKFLSIAAHELRTPLTALLGQAQLLERRITKYPEITERDLRSLSVVVNQAQRLDQLITTLFDLNRLQTGQITLRCAPCDLGELVARLVEELKPTLNNHHFELDLPQEAVVIPCDELRLEQILQNLVQNAIKYSPDGGPIGIRIALDATIALLEVRDSGIGIPEESLPHLFEPYFRAANAERSVMQGLGVGLGIVKELVQLHGGTVSVRSAEGQGSTFTVRLPHLRETLLQHAATTQTA